MAKLKDRPVQKSNLVEDGKSVTSGRSTPVMSGRSTSVTSGKSTPVTSGRSTPVISGRCTPVTSGRSTPVTSGRTTPVTCSSGRSSVTYDTPVTSGTSTPVAFGAFPVNVMSFDNDSSTSCLSPAAEQTDIPQNEVSGDMSNGDLSLDMVSIFCSSFH